MSILPFDEINALTLRMRDKYLDREKLREEDREDFIDEMLDLFLLSFAQGNEVTNDSLLSNWEPTLDEVMEVVDRPVAGKTWRERTNQYFDDGGTVEDIARIIETEAHRIANEAAFTTAGHDGATQKTWHCMMLPTSRDTHIYLDGVKAPIDGEFYSFKGGSTKYPGQWGIAEEDINCMCWLTFEK